MATIFEGVLYKRGRINTAWKVRYCDLRKEGCGDVVFRYFDSKSSRKLLGSIPISDCYAVEVVSDYDLKYEYVILSGYRMLDVYVHSPM